MPVLSIFCCLASWVMGGSSVSVSVSVSAVSSCTCVDRWACFARDSASCFRLPPRLWSTVRRVLVIKRVILGCVVTLCLYLFAPGVSSVLARFFRCPRCHCLVIASQCLVTCLSSRICHCPKSAYATDLSTGFSLLSYSLAHYRAYGVVDVNHSYWPS